MAKPKRWYCHNAANLYDTLGLLFVFQPLISSPKHKKESYEQNLLYSHEHVSCKCYDTDQRKYEQIQHPNYASLVCRGRWQVTRASLLNTSWIVHHHRTCSWQHLVKTMSGSKPEKERQKMNSETFLRSKGSSLMVPEQQKRLPSIQLYLSVMWSLMVHSQWWLPGIFQPSVFARFGGFVGGSWCILLLHLQYWTCLPVQASGWNQFELWREAQKIKTKHIIFMRNQN